MFWYAVSFERAWRIDQMMLDLLMEMLIVWLVLTADASRFVLSDPGLKKMFNADYCVTELGGASIPDFKLRPTLAFFQSTAEKGELIFPLNITALCFLCLHVGMYLLHLIFWLVLLNETGVKLSPAVIKTPKCILRTGCVIGSFTTLSTKLRSSVASMCGTVW